jgi:hypothetical protein
LGAGRRLAGALRKGRRMRTITVQIGNSDDKLTQVGWSDFVRHVARTDEKNIMNFDNPYLTHITYWDDTSTGANTDRLDYYRSESFRRETEKPPRTAREFLAFKFKRLTEQQETKNHSRIKPWEQEKVFK